MLRDGLMTLRRHGWLGVLAILAAGCVFSWDDFDPRLSGSGAGGSATGGGGGLGGQGGTGASGGGGGSLPNAPQPIAALASESDDDDPTFDEEALELYFSSTRSGDENVWVSTRATTTDPWSDPVQVAELNTSSQESNPVIAPDGLTLWLASRRDGQAATDVYVATRPDKRTAWSTPAPVAELNDANATDAPNYVTADELTMILERDGDLHTATRPTDMDPWQDITPIDEVNGVTFDGGSWQSPDKLRLFFASTRTGNREIYESTRTTDAGVWGAPVPMAEVNTDVDEADPWLSVDLTYMVFARTTDTGRQLFEYYR